MNKGVMLAICVAVASAACGSSAPTGTATQNQPTADQTAANAQAAREPNPSNELPFGRVDLPKPDAVVDGGKVVASGWAVDDSAVRGVRVFVDSRFYTTARLTIDREDLTAQLPKYMHGSNTHGWTTAIDLAALPGTHAILFQAEDDQGATRDLGTVSVTVPGAK